MCGLSTATIEYSCPSVCVAVCLSVCLCVCLFVYTITKKIMVQHLKLEHIFVYGNSSEEFYIFSALAHVRKLRLSMSVNQIIIYKIYYHCHA